MGGVRERDKGSVYVGPVNIQFLILYLVPLIT